MTDVQTSYVEINGARTYYEIGGISGGETLVFLHAGVADCRLYDAQFEFFAPHYRVMRYDLRGAGNTEAPIPSPEPYSFIDDLHELLAYLKIERAALIGTSNGGMVSLNFALTYPEQVTALVLTCSGVTGYEAPEYTAPEIEEQVFEAMKQGDVERVADLGTQMWFVGVNRTHDQVDGEAYAKAREMMRQAYIRTGQGLGEEVTTRPPAVKRLHEIKIPTLVIVGAEDIPILEEMSDQIVEQVPDARKVVMQDTAHLPSLEHPEQYTQIVAEFLNEALKQPDKE